MRCWIGVCALVWLGACSPRSVPVAGEDDATGGAAPPASAGAPGAGSGGAGGGGPPEPGLPTAPPLTFAPTATAVAHAAGADPQAPALVPFDVRLAWTPGRFAVLFEELHAEQEC